MSKDTRQEDTTRYKLYDTYHNKYLSLRELNARHLVNSMNDMYNKSEGEITYDKEEILDDLKEFHMEYGSDVTLEDLCREYGWRVDEI